MKKLDLSPEQARKRQWISGAVLFLFIISCMGVYKYLVSLPKEDNVIAPFRKVLAINEKVANAIGSSEKLSPEYLKGQAAKPARANGRVGLSMVIDPITYRFKVINNTDTSRNLAIGLAELKKLPYKDLVFDFKCIEGWSQIQHWGGITFRDFVVKYHLGSKTDQAVVTGQEPWAYKYVGMETPDGGYYVGMDMKSAMHAQTILAWNMNDAPLPQKQGAPLRLIIPVKYGVKHIKQIGKIFFSDLPPRDYWAERGYDYDSGL
jgi:DMSO/TMAO reductase YedYZ molybdopterin-dependent catalytic subunit